MVELARRRAAVGCRAWPAPPTLLGRRARAAACGSGRRRCEQRMAADPIRRARGLGLALGRLWRRTRTPGSAALAARGGRQCRGAVSEGALREQALRARARTRQTAQARACHGAARSGSSRVATVAHATARTLADAAPRSAARRRACPPTRGAAWRLRRRSISPLAA